MQCGSVLSGTRIIRTWENSTGLEEIEAEMVKYQMAVSGGVT
jgi:hypothetical protein